MTLTSDQVAEKLAEPFPSELLRQNKAKGNITYVAGSEVIARLNRVLGLQGWSYEILRTWEAGEQTTDTGTFPTWVMAHVRLSARIDYNHGFDGATYDVVRDGIGGQAVKKLNSGAGVVDLGDEYKGAVTDALKKAAMSLGVALDLSRGEEAMRWEADQSDDIDCPKCGASIKDAKNDREPMRAHLVEMHGYLRNEDGTVLKPKPEVQQQGSSTASTSAEADERGRAAISAKEGSEDQPSLLDRPTIGAVRGGAK